MGTGTEVAMESVLHPRLDLLLGPMIASAAMSLSSVSVIGSVLRLRRALV